METTDYRVSELDTSLSHKVQSLSTTWSDALLPHPREDPPKLLLLTPVMWQVQDTGSGETQQREHSLAASTEGSQVNQILKPLSPAVLYQTKSI